MGKAAQASDVSADVRRFIDQMQRLADIDREIAAKATHMALGILRDICAASAAGDLCDVIIQQHVLLGLAAEMRRYCGHDAELGHIIRDGDIAFGFICHGGFVMPGGTSLTARGQAFLDYLDTYGYEAILRVEQKGQTSEDQDELDQYKSCGRAVADAVRNGESILLYKCAIPLTRAPEGDGVIWGDPIQSDDTAADTSDHDKS